MLRAISSIRFWHEADKAVELKVGNERKAEVKFTHHISL